MRAWSGQGFEEGGGALAAADAHRHDAVLAAPALQGLSDATQAGPDGYPLEDIEVVLTAIAHRDDAHVAIGVRAAAAEAVRRAVSGASPVRLEPIMEVEVTVPDEFLGAIIGDLNQRHGHISDMDARGGKRILRVRVPLRNMFGYSTRLRSLSEGRATFTMHFSSYDVLGS